MSAPMSRAQDIAARLAAATDRPARVAHHDDFIRVEIDVPQPLSGVRWRTVLEALDTATRFGLDGGTDRCLAWAEIDQEADL